MRHRGPLRDCVHHWRGLEQRGSVGRAEDDLQRDTAADRPVWPPHASKIEDPPSSGDAVAMARRAIGREAKRHVRAGHVHAGDLLETFSDG